VAGRTKGGTKKGRARAEADEAPGPGVARRAGRVAVGLIVTSLGVAWILGVGPLRARVSEVRTDPVEVAFEWPRAGGGAGETWLPSEVRSGLRQLALATIEPDPFDGASLETARAELMATGWFVSIDAVRRRPGGEVRVEGAWRTPAAVVEKGSRSYLVGMDGAAMRLPSGTSPPASLFRIYEPTSGPRTDERTGGVAWGEPWPDEDVPEAIELLELVASTDVAGSIMGVDLRPYATRGWLSLVTDTWCELVWGAPVGESAPGEASAARKLEHVRSILDPADRLDRGRTRIEVMTDYVFVDRTAGGTGG
jgi:hypothetical protein